MGVTCAEAAARPTRPWGKLPERARRRGLAEGCRQVHVVLDQPALFVPTLSAESRAGTWYSSSLAHYSSQR